MIRIEENQVGYRADDNEQTKKKKLSKTKQKKKLCWGHAVYNSRGKSSSLAVDFDAKAVRLSSSKPVALMIMAR